MLLSTCSQLDREAKQKGTARWTIHQAETGFPMEEAHYDEDPYGHDQGYYLVPDEQGDYDLDEGSIVAKKKKKRHIKLNSPIATATLES